MCYENHPSNIEEAVQAGLQEWVSSAPTTDPPTWKVLLNAMDYARIDCQHTASLKAELRSKTGIFPAYFTICTLGLCNILIISCIAIICLILQYDIFFACYRDNCQRNNNALKVKAQAQIQVHIVLFALTRIVS